MERKLLLLGMLRMQEMYGYQLNEFIDQHLRAGVKLKKPTAYKLLNGMAKDGWVTYREEKIGNRPARRVYDITPQGETAFQKILRESLADYQPTEFSGDISLAFLDLIPAQEALSLLQKRRSIIESLQQSIDAHGHGHGGYSLMIEHQARHLATELEWVDEIISRITTD